jgi:5-methylcytosine-specific restriction endonuclease McrA
MAKEFAKQFYSSLQWKSTRLLVLRRDLYTCQECFGNRAQEVHHIIELTPENINDITVSLNPDNLLSLCHTCHTKITKGSTGDVAEGYVFDDEGNVVGV